MGRQADNNMTNLKSATGVVSNSLSDQNPSGTGKTAYSDFLVLFVGRDIGASYYEQGTVTDGSGDVPPYDTNLSVPPTNANGTTALPTYTGQLGTDGVFHLDNNTLSPGYKMWVRVDLAEGKYAAEQIVKDKLTVKSRLGCKVVDRIHGTVDGTEVVDLQVEVTGYDVIALTLSYEGDPYNDDAIHYNKDLSFSCDSVISASPYLERISVQWDDTGPNGTGVACDGSTALDNLFGFGTAGDDNYGLKVTTNVYDPTNVNDNYYLWVYFDDQNASPPDSPDGIESVGDPVAGKIACTSFRSGILLPDNSYNVYVYITLDEAGNDIWESDFISFTPQTGEFGSNTKTLENTG